MGSSRRARATTRTRALWALTVFLLVAGCGDDTEKSSPATTAIGVVTGEFVGAASDQETYVALYSTNGAFAGESQVVAYVCNRRVDQEGPVFAEWFTGTAINGTVDLTSQSGNAHLRASLEPGKARGTADLPGGRTVTFEATGSESGPAGLFEVSVDDQGNLVATSRGGKAMKLTPFERDGVPGYTGSVTLPSGETVAYELFVRGGVVTKEEVAEMVTPRTIILVDGSSRGILDPIAKKGKGTAN